MSSDDTSTIEVDSFLLAQVKAHLLTDILPEMLGLPNYKQTQEFRERVLRVWISSALEDALRKDGFPPMRRREGK